MTHQKFSQSLKQILNRVPKLREWTRNAVFETNLHRRPENSDQARKDLNRRLDFIAKNQKTIDKFYADLGFSSLPEDNRLVRDWERRIDDLRRRAKKGQTIRTSSNKSKNTQIERGDDSKDY